MKTKRNKRGHMKVHMSPEEKRAIEKEIEDQFADFVADHLLEIEALMLYQLRKQLGFGKKRLKRFYDGCHPTIYDLFVQTTLNPNKDTFTKALKDYGFDIRQAALDREKLPRSK